MTKKEALDYVKLCAGDSKRAAKNGMDFRPANPHKLAEACRVVVTMSAAPQYAKRFAYAYLGGNYDLGYLPE